MQYAYTICLLLQVAYKVAIFNSKTKQNCLQVSKMARNAKLLRFKHKFKYYK